MAQYCRYCSWAIDCGEDKVYCRKRNYCFTEKQAKHTNTCRDFDLNPIDALRQNETGYTPSKTSFIELGGLGKQITLKDVMETNQRMEDEADGDT